MDIRPSNAEIARFLLKFEKDAIGKRSADLMANKDIPYEADPENRVLLEWCSKNGFVDFEVRNKRFGDYSISTQGKLFLMQQRSSSRRLKYWIEDHPFAWSCVMVIVGWMGSEAMKSVGEFIRS